MSALEPTVLEAVEWAERMAPGSGQGPYLATLARAARASLEPATAELISEPSHDTAWIVAALLVPQIAEGANEARTFSRLASLARAVREMMAPDALGGTGHIFDVVKGSFE